MFLNACPKRRLPKYQRSHRRRGPRPNAPLPASPTETIRVVSFCATHLGHSWLRLQLNGRRNLGDSILVYDDVFADGYEFYDFAEENCESAGRIKEVARLAHVGLGFVGPSRIDFRVSAIGEAKVMEVTCKPHLTAHTSFMYALNAMGHSHSDLLKFLVGSAAQRLGIRSI